MNSILVFVVLLDFALCEEPTPQPPQALPEIKKPGEAGRPFKGMVPPRRRFFDKKFDNLSEEEKAELEKKREEIKKEVREKMVKLIQDLNGALDKQSAILDDKALSRKEKLEALRKLKEENPKVYNVLKAIFQQFVPKPKFGRRNGSKRMMGSFGFRRDRKPSRGWQKGQKERTHLEIKTADVQPQILPKPVKPVEANAAFVKA
ncbi:unnamed protein product [Cylicocyclus nassatus]|uniref:SXP/RAL-2 family protein Ani s 5-like cation-binding domain-containing protein n=1 Tax=Cylicocyclus nassatus TaxID=53992 RepID=A0AA36DTI0_CYLNA|nr:unnamed protein product [Cylicocyclus nassatus]